jgi:hypothetical protein
VRCALPCSTPLPPPRLCCCWALRCAT